MGMEGESMAVDKAGRHVQLVGVQYLHPHDRVMDEMLAGWRNQQLSRNLAFSTIDQRDAVVRRFQLTPEKVGGCCKGDSNPGPTHCQSAVPQDPMTPAELQTSLVRRTIRHMATYAYRCAEHGDFDISRPMGMAAATSRCKICNKEAVRVFRAPMLSFAPRALVAAIDRTVKSRDEPEVVSALPPRPVRAHNSTATSNPAWRRLPRP
jgi:hypothetical protein